MQDEQIKPCPCCGAAAELRETSTHDYFIKCSNPSCGVSTKRCHENANGAKSIWNSRAE